MKNEKRLLTITLPEYHTKGAVYPFNKIDDFLEDPDVETAFLFDVSSGKVLKYVNAPAAFDIETTSFYAGTEEKNEKVAIMYIWQLGINGAVLYGRTWDEFRDALNRIQYKFGLTNSRRLLVYVHNLAFEFQFIKDQMSWDKVFALKNRVPVYAITGGFEFRCSYKLSNFSLAYIGDHLLRKYKVQKLVGNLDYSLPRHTKTPLTQEELDYAVYDDYVVMAYIRERMEDEGGDISQIPLTNTGYVRRHCRLLTISSPDYVALIRRLKIGNKEYYQLKNAFMGGFTHANVEHVNKTLYNISSYDIASDYPARICLNYFPMSASSFIPRIEDPIVLQYYLEHYCCIFKLAAENIRPNVPYENILSVHRCRFLENQKDYVANNGRLVSCHGWIETTLTEIDYKNLCYFYTWDHWEISDIYVYDRGYLPTEFVSAVLDFYEKKTTLKGVEGKENEYGVSKNMLNSTYGMMVTDPVRDNIEFAESGWCLKHAKAEKSMNAYNNNHNRFLFYPWGVYVTAHARDQLFTMMREIEDDYVYSDTDSLKIKNVDLHAAKFEKYNNEIKNQICKAAYHHGIPYERFMPKDPSGKAHPIGVFEYEGTYDMFKTCGAKRYIYTENRGKENEKTQITVAGLGKSAGMNYLNKKYGPKLDDIYDAFTDGLYVPPGESGKLTHTYIDKPRSGVMTDYLGNKAYYYEKSATHLEPASFYMSMLDSYLRYLYGVEELQYFE